ncbi:MAG: YCF48-related protein [Gammaproteobacteria bacterium]|nr:YCF48-related protein [Gammaproteobacteria bacterium]MDE0270204.1 YCF48-related protein [Gammaproteobacteria bacterium]
MRWLMTCALAALAAGAAANRSGEVLSLVRAGLPHDALYDLAFVGPTGLAVGHHGLLLLSEDGGEAWRAIEPISEAAMLAVDANQERVVVVGQQGRIFSGTDASTLSAVESPTTERLLSVALHESGLAVAVGGFGAVVISEDGGATWEARHLDWIELQPEGLEAHLYGVSISDDGEILICGEFAMILASGDRGQTWQVRHRGDASLFAMHVDGQGSGFAIGQEGTVLRTRDAGATWQPLATGSRANLLDVWHSKEGEVVAIGIRALLRSRDHGQTWASVGGRAVERSWYAALAPGIVKNNLENGTLQEQRVYAAGERGSIVTVNQ